MQKPFIDAVRLCSKDAYLAAWYPNARFKRARHASADSNQLPHGTAFYLDLNHDIQYSLRFVCELINSVSEAHSLVQVSPIKIRDNCQHTDCLPCIRKASSQQDKDSVSPPLKTSG